MNRFRAALGIATGVFLLLSSGAHSFLGWKGLSAELDKTGVPAPLVTGLRIGWQFAGAAMFGFGCIVVSLFTAALKEHRVSLRPTLLIGLLYSSFSVWALAVSDFDLFFLIFLVPGLVLVVCSWPQRSQPS